MNLLLLHEADRSPGGGDAFRVGGARARHLCDVIGVSEGDSVRVGLLEGPLGEGRVESIEADGIVLRCEFGPEPPARPLLDLVLAIPRPKSLRKLLPQVAALGVDRLVLLRTWRVGKPYLTARILQPEVYRPLLYDGLMQARCTREPRVTVEPLFKPFVEDRAPDLFGEALRLTAHPPAERPLASVTVGATQRVALAVGPEGGFLPYEVDALAAAGFGPVTLGGRTLRVETACVALLAQIEMLRRLPGE